MSQHVDFTLRHQPQLPLHSLWPLATVLIIRSCNINLKLLIHSCRNHGVWLFKYVAILICHSARDNPHVMLFPLEAQMLSPDALARCSHKCSDALTTRCSDA
jgi:hypothetical protein